MAALMRCARFFIPVFHSQKLLRVTFTGSAQINQHLLSQNPTSLDQRSWTSKLAEDIDSVPPTTSKIENLINVLERYVKQFGRVSRKQLDPIVSHLDKEGTISAQNSLSLLRLYGATLFDEPPSTRLKLAQELWDKYKKYDIPLDVTHYNALLGVYIQNKQKFSPTEFLAAMESDGIQPNRVTYQRLIASFCEGGDIQGATQVLEYMKAASLPISDVVFNAFITGHLRAGDPDSAKNILDVMRQTGLEPTSSTYQVLAAGFAEKGDIEEMKKFINLAEIENVPLRPNQLLEVYTVLAAATKNSQHLKEVLTFLHSGIPFNQDAVRTCNQLIASGLDDAAYQLFLEMPRPSQDDSDHPTLGRFFLRALARHQRPLDTVVKIINDMQEKGINKDDLSAVAHLAFLENKPEYALKVVEKMKLEGFPIRAHYFWPAFCQFQDAGDKKNIYETLKVQKTLCENRDDFILTLHSYVIPALTSLGESQDEIVKNLKAYDFQEREVNFACFLYHLTQGTLQPALKFLDGRELFIIIGAVRAAIIPFLHKTQDWKGSLEILALLKAQSDRWKTPALDLTSTVLKQILLQQKEKKWVNVPEIFDFMEKNELRITRRSQSELELLMENSAPELLKRLNDLAANEADTEKKENPEPSLPDLTLQELRHLAEKNPNNKSVQKRLLVKACAVGDEEEAEKVRSKLEEGGFIFPPIVLSQLAYLYAAHVKNIEKAQHYLQQLETLYPDHKHYMSLVLKIALLQVSNGQVDAAVGTLQSFAQKHPDVIKMQNFPKDEYFRDVVKAAKNVEEAKKLKDAIYTLGYITTSNTSALDAYMDFVVSSGDGDFILKEVENIINLHRRSPGVDQVLKYFIEKEDPERLQKVVDLLTELHGLVNVFHHLIADFIECGHVKKARKILETPGLRASKQRLSYYCQHFIESGKIKELETLVEITKDLFGADRDNMLFHLMRGYVSQNNMEKAKDVLLQYEEEFIQPSQQTLRFLARNLQKRGMPVPFNVEDKPEAKTTETIEEAKV
ncbi:leucine-rich PPR motif-containing protein, mitochondrial-like [Pomacea canaliculata]|uniref:leucine-rich PPR motif-containing protein, mitochondrial-like n=1 Tax=Pomacea canaliculata TaxID=400727 RepID=UPI000D72B0CB|nr:leucine-rich PPR motif-containing protein, mitochondrial-like [Pomacea canaliculata]